LYISELILVKGVTRESA